MKSPCIAYCQIDKSTGLCQGCKRSIVEIRNWRHYTDSERDEIMSSLSQRSVDKNT